MKKWLGRLINVWTGAAVGLWLGGNFYVGAVMTFLYGNPASPETAYAKMLSQNVLGIVFCVAGPAVLGAACFHFLGVYLRKGCEGKKSPANPPPIARP